MNESGSRLEVDCEAQIYVMEKELLRKMRSLNISEITLVSTHFQGGESALILNINGSWAVKSVMGYYIINNPLLDKLLEKFALLTSPEFQDKFSSGGQNDYECERHRLRDLEKLLRLRRFDLMISFLDRMLQVSISLKTA